MYPLPTLVLITTLLVLTDTAKVLVVPHNMPSHYVIFCQIANALVDENNEVTLLIPSSAKIAVKVNTKVNTEVYQVNNSPFVTSKEFAEMEVQVIKSRENILEYYKLMKSLADEMLNNVIQDCEDLFADKDLFAKLNKAKYDIIISDVLDLRCFPAYYYKLGVPISLVSLSIPNWQYRVSCLPSTWPSVTTEMTNEMNFKQRFTNFALEILSLSFMNGTTYYIEKYVPEKPVITASHAVQQAVLWFYLYDQVISYPRVSMPNTIDIGDIMIRRARPVPSEFEEAISTSKNGVIIVSLGSYFDHIPEEWLQEFCRAFELVEQVVLWKLKITPPCSLPSNVFVKKWLPQNDLLAHKKVKLFISHGGYNSFLESVTNAVPLIVLPLVLDQRHNAYTIENKGIGIRMDILNFTAQGIASNIKKIITNETYYLNVKTLSLRFQDKPQSAGKRMSHWINHVAKFGGGHLRSKAYDLSIFQFLMLDIYLFVLVIIIMVITIVILVLYCTCRFMRKFFRRKQKTE